MTSLTERAKEVGFVRAALEHGATITDGPVPRDFTAVWGKHPFKGKSVAHYWTAERPAWMAEVSPDMIYAISSACGLSTIGTKQVPLLGAGNLPFCVRCENKLMGRVR